MVEWKKRAAKASYKDPPQCSLIFFHSPPKVWRTISSRTFSNVRERREINYKSFHWKAKGRKGWNEGEGESTGEIWLPWYGFYCDGRPATSHEGASEAHWLVFTQRRKGFSCRVKNFRPMLILITPLLLIILQIHQYCGLIEHICWHWCVNIYKL